MAEDMVCWEQKIASMWRKCCSSFALLILLACGESQKQDLAQLPYYNQPDFSPLFLSDPKEIAKQVTHTAGLDSLVFLNQDSLEIGEPYLANKVVVVNFIFTGCGSICPTMTGNLTNVTKQYSADSSVVFLSFSVTPWKDRCAQLKSYKIANNLDKFSNWHFLTGKKSEIYTLARKKFFAEETIGFTKDSTEFLHTEHILLRDQQGRLRGIYNGTLQPDMNHLAEDIALVKK